MVTETELLDADRRARLAALDVTRSYIVQAPAGSGKTELLIQRYLRLLGTVEEPEEILAITFTRKAALEMRLRVVKALQQAQRGETAEHAHERLTLEAAADVLARDADRGWDLLESPARMRIQTLDALCAGIARLLPLSSGLGGVANAIADAEIKSVYRAAAVATLDWLVGDDTMNSAVEQVLSHLDNNTAIYVAHVARMLETRDQWLKITGPGSVADPDAVRRRLEENIADIIRHHLGITRARLAALDVSDLPALAGYAGVQLVDAGKADHAAAPLAGLRSLPGAEVADLVLWQGIAELLLTRDGSWRKTVNKTSGFPTGDDGQKEAWMSVIAGLSSDRHLPGLLHKVRSLPRPRYDDQQWQVLLALFKVLPLAVIELQRIFSAQGITDHTEVARAAETALGSAEAPGDVALMLDYRIRHLLVDEMQDTSIGQYGLLETLTAGWQPGDGRTLFCVGDPMQSIYRFRNAEVGQFVLARETGISGIELESLMLRQNFRSGERLVHWFNTVFEQVFPDRDDIASGAITYSESVPVDSLADAGEYHVHALFDVTNSEEAARTADVVAGCLQRSEDENVAVLVRSRTQLPLLLAELRQKDIEYRAVEIDRLTDLPEIIELLALTRAVCHPADRAAWLGLLRGPLVGLDWTDLHRLVRDATDEPVWNLVRAPDRVETLSESGRALLSRFVPVMLGILKPNCVQTLRQRLEIAWFGLRGPALIQNEEQLDNVYRFFDVIEKIEVAGTLADPAELEQRLDDERVSSRAGGDCRLQVMTVHKAKGLQFDHVVLPALGRSTNVSQKSVLSWLNIPQADGSRDMIISPVGPRSELDNDPLHQYIDAALKDSERLELDRLLYVACTRARRSLHLVGHVNTAKSGEMSAPHSGSLLARLWPALRGVYEQAFESASAPSSAEAGDEELWALPELKRVDPNWVLPAPPALPARNAKVPEPPTDDPRDVEFYWVGTAARYAGTIVHRWLQKFAREGEWPEAGQLDSTEQLTSSWARTSGAARHDLDGVCARVRRALAGVLEDPRGRWLLGGDGAAELALTGLWENRPVSIIIDRVRVDDEGTHWIIDYKTSTHEGGDLPGFLEQETGRYRPQLLKYAEIYRHFSGAPVRAALYFPLLQQFCEVDLGDA